MDDNYRWHLLRLKRHEIMLRRAFGRFRECGFEPILIKGWAIAKLYPWGVPRFFGDIDLAVTSSDFENAFRFCQHDDIRILDIDLHNEFRHLDTQPWDELFGRSQLIDLEGTDIRVLCPEDHLRVLCVHWLTDGGAYKEKLWDIYYAVENRGPDFNWDLCLITASEVRRRWIIYTIGLAHEYLGLEIGDLPFADEAKNTPKWLRRAVEKEWKSPGPPLPIHTCLGDRKLFLEQIRKRFPPNPIQSTVDMEGSFDADTTTYYQIGSFFKRLSPSVKRVLTTIRTGAKRT
ncbi:MAG: nucleotidyltransferase family protein [Saprospiraceae bacterium]|nr:nucleotidyltransferase family protein [Pyrinomonadaceae bacterium]